MKFGMELQLPQVELAMPQLEHKVEHEHRVEHEHTVEHKVEHIVQHRVTHAVEPRVEKKTKKKQVVKTQGSQLSSIIKSARVLEPVYFQSFDCVGFPNFLTCAE